jgi:hypothetical protein
MWASIRHSRLLVLLVKLSPSVITVNRSAAIAISLSRLTLPFIAQRLDQATHYPHHNKIANNEQQ